jgi:phage tail-like protein
MAETGARNDPFPAFRFEVRLDGLPAAGFSECSGLQVETEFHDQPVGGLNTHLIRRPTRTKLSNIVLKRGIVDKKLWDWYADLVAGKVTFRNGSVVLHDPSGSEEVMKWDFEKALPCKWQGPDLNATQNSVAIETLELCHHGLQRVK